MTATIEIGGITWHPIETVRVGVWWLINCGSVGGSAPVWVAGTVSVVGTEDHSAERHSDRFGAKR